MFVWGSHAFAMCPPTHYVRGGATRVHTCDDLYPIWSKLEYRLPACITKHPAHVAVSGHFFLLSVWSP